MVLNGGGPYGNVRYLDEDDIPFEVVDPSLGREIDDDRPFDLFRMRRVEKDRMHHVRGIEARRSDDLNLRERDHLPGAHLAVDCQSDEHI